MNNLELNVLYKNEENSRMNDSLSNTLSCRNRWITNMQNFFGVFFTLNMFNSIFKVGTVLTGITGFILAIIQITQEQSLNNYALFFIALFTISKDAREFVFYVIEGHPVPHNNLVGIK